MSYQFKHYEKGSAQGSGSYVFRRYSEPSGEVPTTSAYFKFNGTTLTGMSSAGETAYGNGDLTEIVIPRTYSITSTTTTTQTFYNIYDLEDYCYNYGFNFSFEYNGDTYYVNSDADYYDYQTYIEDIINTDGQIDITVTETEYGDGNDYQVTTLGTYALQGRDLLKKVTLLDNITTMNNEVFGNCTGLTSVILSNGLTNIGPYAFLYCTALTSITIPDSVTDIGLQAFSNCTGLTSITIPNSVTKINSNAFTNCTSLTSIFIPSNVITIGGGLFVGCTNLTSIVVDSNNPAYDSRDNCNAIITTATNVLNSGCVNTIIPNSVTVIGGSAFSGLTNLTSITIPNNVTTISAGAFQGCGLTSITIPSSVTIIDTYAFRYCTSLTDITIPSSVTIIGQEVFNDCTNLTSVTIPSSVTSISYMAFKNCTSLVTANIYSTSSSKKMNAKSNTWFNGCSSNLVLHIPSSVTNPATAYGQYWNYYSSNGTLTYYADL